MKKPSVQIFLYENGGNILSCLSSIQESTKDIALDLYCLCNDSQNANVLEERCAWLREKEYVNEFRIICQGHEDAASIANRLFLRDCARTDKSAFIFFLADSIFLTPNVIGELARNLADDADCAGLNPLLLAGWKDHDRERVAHLGIVCDCQKYIHYLYEGLPADNPLAREKRFFQLGHPGALIVRKEDFVRLDGLLPQLEYLVWYDFCIRVGRLRKAGFSTAPSCVARLVDRFDSWKACGILNSALRTGRVSAEALAVDYPDIVARDGLEMDLDGWLNEYVADLPLETTPDSTEEGWLDFRHKPNPLSLLKYISVLPATSRPTAFELCTALPASLPGLFEYYKVQAAKIASFANDKGFDRLESLAAMWLKKSKRFHHGLLRPGISLLQKAGIYNCSLDWSTAIYPAWVEIGESFKELVPGKEWPLISVIMPVYNPQPEFLVQAIESARAQKYARWQLCIADDASSKPEIGEILRSRAALDARIDVVFREQNGHISRASNSALELAKGPFTAFLDHDDMLSPHALGLVAENIVKNPGCAYLYSDDDRIDANNIRRNAVFKPDFDYDLFYTGHLSTFKTDLARNAGGLRTGFEGSQDQDLRLRVTETLDLSQIVHIPNILYHWRVHEESSAGSLAAKPYVIEATKKVWLESAARKGRKARIVETDKNNFFILAYELPQNIACDVILLLDSAAPEPTRELAACLEKLAQSISLRIYLQPFGDKKPGKIGKLRATALPACGRDWPGALNAAASQAKGPLILFLYAGLRPLANCAPEQMIIEALRSDLAMVGGLVWQNGLLLNGGWYPDVTGLPFPLLRGISASRLGTSCWSQFLLPRHTLGLPWQCLATRKEIIDEDEFLDESLGNYALVDFALRWQKRGKYVLASPFGQWDCQREEAEPTSLEMEKLRERFGDEIRHSGLRNPNLRAAPDNDWTLGF